MAAHERFCCTIHIWVNSSNMSWVPMSSCLLVCNVYVTWTSTSYLVWRHVYTNRQWLIWSSGISACFISDPLGLQPFLRVTRLVSCKCKQFTTTWQHWRCAQCKRTLNMASMVSRAQTDTRLNLDANIGVGVDVDVACSEPYWLLIRFCLFF